MFQMNIEFESSWSVQLMQAKLSQMNISDQEHALSANDGSYMDLQFRHMST